METWKLVISVVNGVFSAATFILGLIIYCAHDRKLKQIEQEIKKYQLKQLEEEEQANKKADIVGEMSLIQTGDSGVLCVFNRGLSSAKNIRIEGFDYENYTIHNNAILPYDCLNAGEDFSLRIFRIRRSFPTMTITFIWDDEWGIDRKKQQIIPLR